MSVSPSCLEARPPYAFVHYLFIYSSIHPFPTTCKLPRLAGLTSNDSNHIGYFCEVRVWFSPDCFPREPSHGQRPCSTKQIDKYGVLNTSNRKVWAPFPEISCAWTLEDRSHMLARWPHASRGRRSVSPLSQISHNNLSLLGVLAR